MVSGRCESHYTDSLDEYRVGFFVMLMNYTARAERSAAYSSHNSTVVYGNVTVLQSVSLLCRPLYNISQAELVYKGDAPPRVTVSADATPRVIQGVHPSHITEAFFDSFRSAYLYRADKYQEEQLGLRFRVGEAQVDVDHYAELAFGSFVGPETNVSSLMDEGFVTQMLERYYERFGAQIARRGLLKQASLPSTGTALESDDRLVVRDLGCHLMAACSSSRPS